MSSPVSGITYPLYSTLFLKGADPTLGREPFLTHFRVTDVVT